MHPTVATPGFIASVESVGAGSPAVYSSRFDPAGVRSADAPGTSGMDPEENPTFYLVIGPTGSGKSSAVVAAGLDAECGQTVLCSRNYLRGLGYSPKRFLFAVRQVKSLAQGLLDGGVTFGVETAGSSDYYVRVERQAKRLGYRVELLAMTVRDPLISFGRSVRSQAEGPPVDWQLQHEYYGRSMKMLASYVREADDATVFDNSGSSPSLQLLKRDRKVYLAPDRYASDWLYQYIRGAYTSRPGDIPQEFPLRRKARVPDKPNIRNH